MRNVVFMPNIDTGDDRSRPYKYSVASWKKWCNKNDCEFVIFDEPICSVEQMKITWQRYYALDMLENSNIEFDQVLLIDADTIIHPECPNFFELTENKFCAVHNDGSYDWILRSIENYHKHAFNDAEVPFEFWEYFNTGFLIINKSHKEFIHKFLKFYNDNSELFITLQNTYHVGTCQPVINFFTRQENVDVKLLPYSFNMQDLPRKEILDEELTMTKVGWIYHYNAISQEFQRAFGNVEYWMKKTYEHLYGPLDD